MSETVDLRDTARGDPELLQASARGWHGVPLDLSGRTVAVPLAQASGIEPVAGCAG